MYSDNCFLLLGRTGVGKSTLTKILSEDESIIIGDSLNSQTQETNCYNCQIDDFKYCLIDTPGYDDSTGKDEKNYGDIKKFMTSNSHKIKGIVLLFSFQDTRFGESHMKGLQKIVSLIPLKNFWEYVTIIFTRTFNGGDEEELNEEKEEKLKNYKGTFEVIISAFNKAKNIDEVPFEKIKKVFIDLKVKKTKKNQLDSITSIFKKNAKLEPLYHDVKISEKYEEAFLLKDKVLKNGELIKLKIKIYQYVNQKGKIIKELSKPIEKIFIKEMTQTEYESKFKKPFIIDLIDGINAVIPLFGFAIFTVLGFSNPFIFKIYKGINEKKILEDLQIDEYF